MANAAHNARKGRESFRKRLGKIISTQIDARDGGRCQYCQRTEQEAGRGHTFDHVRARARGGAELDPKNIVTCCHRCNSMKQALNEKEWHEYAAARGIQFDPKQVVSQAKKVLPDYQQAKQTVERQRAAHGVQHVSQQAKIAVTPSRSLTSRVNTTRKSIASAQVGRRGGRFVTTSTGRKLYLKR